MMDDLTNADAAFLQWIYNRLHYVHKENENYDYMLKFKSIIEKLEKVTAHENVPYTSHRDIGE